MYDRFFQLSKQLDEQGLQHINTYERGLRRLCNSNEYAELKNLTDVLVPVRGYKNLFGRLSNATRLANNSTPLIDVGDIISTDSQLKRLFRKNVTAYMVKKDSDAEDYLRKELQLWTTNHNKLVNAGMGQSRYANIAPHSANLQKLAEAGLKALDKIKAGQSFTPEELAEYQKLVTEAKKPQGDTVLDVVLEIESLIMQKLIPEPKEFPLL
jgi:hexosaminidase